MAVYAYDIDGYVGDLGTNTGWAYLCDFFRTSGNEEAKFLADEGWSDGFQVDTLDPPGDEVLAGLLENFKSVAKRCREILIVSQGFEE